MEEIKFKYTDNNRYIFISIFCSFLSLGLLLSALYIDKIISYNTINNIIFLLCLIIGFLLFLGIPVFLIITYNKTEKYGIALIKNDSIELIINNIKHSININEIKNIKLTQNQVRMGKYAIWFYVYVLNIITTNKHIKIKASIDESKKTHENGGNVSIKILYNKIYDIIKSKNNGT
jgi:hypothetical protein